MKTPVLQPVSPERLALTGFCANLVAARERNGWTQAQLAERSGLMPAAVSHFETGERRPSLRNLVKIADALGCSVDSLLGRQAGRDNAEVYRKLCDLLAAWDAWYRSGESGDRAEFYAAVSASRATLGGGK